MTEPSSVPDHDGAILLRFQHDHEAADDKGAVVQDYCDRYPSLAARVRARAAMVPLLCGSGSEPAEPLPERFGEFRVVRRIGGGGMGRVYEARHERLNRRVAVKTIRPDRASPVAIDRFRREQRALARLHQTHIVSIFEAGEEGPVHYFAMPYIDGAALSHVVQTALHQETSSPQSQTPSLAKFAAQLAAEQEKAEEGSTDGASAGRPVGTATSPALPPAARSARLALSAEYFRSVAGAMADAAEAIQHTHDAGLLHRDVKPSNLMVDRHGHCWVIDFGLAGQMAGRGRQDAPPADPVLAAEPVTATGFLGTPQYMAPEQWARGKDAAPLDARTDVYGLGVTLYELLTLRRAFDGDTTEVIRARALAAEPAPVRALVANAPADLAAVCRRAMRKEAPDRYATARELADDLRRWLRHEPTRAQGAWVGRRMWLWGKRNPGWAAACVVALLAFTALAAGAGLYHERNREAERQSLIRRAENVRLKPRSQGWRDDAWELQRKAAKVRTDELLRDQAAATLAGLDAYTEKEFGTFDAPWLTFDAKGEQLLFSGAPAAGSRPAAGAKVWDLKKQELAEPLKRAAAGPVAFRPDGVPVQLVPDGKLALELWDVAKGTKLKEFRFPEQVREQDGWGLARIVAGLAVLAMSRDGSLVAASAVDGKGGGLTVVWAVASGKQLLEVARPATAVSFAPSDTLFATGDSEGSVALWSLPEGKPAGKFRASRLPVYALDFGQDAGAAGGGLLRGRVAAGGAGGGLIIWDLQENMTRAICRGSLWDVYAVAFSPDGMLLASAGRDHVHLWDAATGAPLLSWPVGSYYSTSLAFSPDGNLLAAGGHTVIDPGGVVVRRLEDGRGVRTLRGLTQPVIHVSLSPDGRRVAALAHNWEVAVWDLPQGRLRRVLQAPHGTTADNAGLAFSRDGRRLAFATTGGARLWEVDSGKELGSWDIPRGIVDRLAFDDKDRLLLFRAERNGDGAVCRVRDLFGARPLEPIAETNDFDGGVLAGVLAPDGSTVVVAGLSGPGKDRWVRAYEAPNGKELWAQQMPDKLAYSLMAIDPTGKFVSVSPNDHVAEVATGKRVGARANADHGLSPGARWGAALVTDEATGAVKLSLHRRKDGAAFVSLGIDVMPSSAHVQFDADGTRVVWGNSDGTVSVADLTEVQRRLAELGLGWE